MPKPVNSNAIAKKAPSDKVGTAVGSGIRQSTKASVCVLVLTFAVRGATKNVSD